jgi:hypothetical protein
MHNARYSAHYPQTPPHGAVAAARTLRWKQHRRNLLLSPMRREKRRPTATLAMSRPMSGPAEPYVSTTAAHTRHGPPTHRAHPSPVRARERTAMGVVKETLAGDAMELGV